MNTSTTNTESTNSNATTMMTTKEIKKLMKAEGITVQRCATIRGCGFVNVDVQDREAAIEFMTKHNLLHTLMGKVYCSKSGNSYEFPGLKLENAVRPAAATRIEHNGYVIVDSNLKEGWFMTECGTIAADNIEEVKYDIDNPMPEIDYEWENMVAEAETAELKRLMKAAS